MQGLESPGDQTPRLSPLNLTAMSAPAAASPFSFFFPRASSERSGSPWGVEGGQALTPSSVQGCGTGGGPSARPLCQPGPGGSRAARHHAGHPRGTPASDPRLSPHLQQRG